MFRFEYPSFLWLLLLIPILVLMWMHWRQVRRKRLQLFGETELVTQLTNGISHIRPLIRFCLATTALALLIIALARPQFGAKLQHERHTGIEAIIAMDVSNSMWAKDVAPSRLQKSKMLVENLIEHFTNDKVGMIVFAAKAYTQLPITSDYVSAKMFLQELSPTMMSQQGTDIAAAIRLAMLSFTQDEDIGKAIILITDGEDHEGEAIAAAKEAKEKGIRVFILGVGTADGAEIPLPGENERHLTDNSGETVITRLNEEMCKEIAQAGSGTYIHVDNSSAAQQQLDREIGKMQKGETDQLVYSEYDEQFQAVTLLAVIMLILACIIPSSSKGNVDNKSDNINQTDKTTDK